jgi:hypothetical protein
VAPAVFRVASEDQGGLAAVLMCLAARLVPAACRQDLAARRTSLAMLDRPAAARADLARWAARAAVPALVDLAAVAANDCARRSGRRTAFQER